MHMRKWLLITILPVTLFCLILVNHIPQKMVEEAVITQNTIAAIDEVETTIAPFEPEWEVPESSQASNAIIIENELIPSDFKKTETESSNQSASQPTATAPHFEKTETESNNHAASQPTETESPVINPPTTQPTITYDDGIVGGADVGVGGEIEWG